LSRITHGQIDERTIVPWVKEWIDELNNFRAEVEEHVQAKRNDLIVFFDESLLFTGEFKRPTVVEGRSPRNIELLRDAYQKAAEKGASFYVTSNFNETVVYDRRDSTRPVVMQEVDAFTLPDLITKDDDFRDPHFKILLEEQTKAVARRILSLKDAKVSYRPLDQTFLLGLQAQLSAAIEATVDTVPLRVVRKWWREQGYLPVADFDREHKQRLARYSLYILANKIMFYYVLKRSFPSLPVIETETVKNVTGLHQLLSARFDEAKETSRDYEPVFEETEADKTLFLSERALTPLKHLILFLNEYKITDLPQELLGNIYDRLLSPEERHAYGQYYTPIPVVDLINCLTIKSKDARILDPACGSGTFLTRAFDLELKLLGRDNRNARERVLEKIFGVDIAVYPAHLATVSLASKLLTLNPNVYPNVVRKNFLSLQIDEMIPKLAPQREKLVTLDRSHRTVSFRPIDAVVSNLPYIRQEDIDDKETEIRRVEMFLRAHGFYSEKPGNTADFHAYFWYYVLPFLGQDSHIGFLTSDTWMNVEYGDDLKKFIDRHFKIIAIIDSSIERWFEDALVNTSITILQKSDVESDRKDNLIRFVRLNRPIVELVSDLESARKVASAIEGGNSMDGVSIRIVRQGDLDFSDPIKSKLYPYLRAPKEFFELIMNSNMVPVSDVMEVQRGFTTGADQFFYVEDITETLTEQQLKNEFGLRKAQTKEVRVVMDGQGVTHPIESSYLHPVITSPKEFTSSGTLRVSQTSKKVVLISEDRKSNIKHHAAKYVEYGERNPPGEPFNQRPTTSARNPWWKLSPVIRPDFAFTKSFSATILNPRTEAFLDQDCYFAKMKDSYRDDVIAAYAFFNSSLSFLYPDFLGRNTGGGSARFAVYELDQLPMPRPEVLRPFYNSLGEAIKQLEGRKIGTVFDEIWDGNGSFELSKVKSDRLKLDRTILRAVGYKEPDEFLVNWYPSVVKMVRERLLKAASLRKTRGASEDLRKVADAIVAKVRVRKFPEDYVNYDVVGVQSKIEAPKANSLRLGNDLMGAYVEFGSKKIRFDSIDDAKFVYYAARSGQNVVRIPDNANVVLKRYERDIQEIRKQVVSEIKDITANEKIETRLLKLCFDRLGILY
jgi:hypothetical protein